jgi:hypothetical protein
MVEMVFDHPRWRSALWKFGLKLPTLIFGIRYGFAVDRLWQILSWIPLQGATRHLGIAAAGCRQLKILMELAAIMAYYVIMDAHGINR